MVEDTNESEETGTERFESAQEYREWVEMLAQNNIDRYDSPAKLVAETCIVDIEQVGDELAMLFSAEMYVDDPVTQTRVFPKDVIAMHPSKSWPTDVESVRELAVALLTDEVKSAMMDMEAQ